MVALVSLKKGGVYIFYAYPDRKSNPIDKQRLRELEHHLHEPLQSRSGKRAARPQLALAYPEIIPAILSNSPVRPRR